MGYHKLRKHPILSDIVTTELFIRSDNKLYAFLINSHQIHECHIYSRGHV